MNECVRLVLSQKTEQGEFWEVPGWFAGDVYQPRSNTWMKQVEFFSTSGTASLGTSDARIHTEENGAVLYFGDDEPAYVFSESAVPDVADALAEECEFLIDFINADYAELRGWRVEEVPGAELEDDQ